MSTSPTEIEHAIRARQFRAAQRKSRGNKSSPRDDAENNAMLLAAASATGTARYTEKDLAEILTDGSVARLRKMRVEVSRFGEALLSALHARRK